MVKRATVRFDDSPPREPQWYLVAHDGERRISSISPDGPLLAETFRKLHEGSGLTVTRVSLQALIARFSKPRAA